MQVEAGRAYWPMVGRHFGRSSQDSLVSVQWDSATEMYKCQTKWSAEIDCDVIGQRSAQPRLLNLAHYAVSSDMTPYLLTVSSGITV